MQLGQIFGGKYRLLRLLGDGGMGSVYEASHEVLGARVAIKVLHEDLARKPELVDRFLREARVLAQINNPHVVRVLDIAMAEEGRSAYIVMELLSGESLAALVTRERRLPLGMAVDYAAQILDALAAAHALGVVHRDLKPENVFVTRDGERTVLKVIDFGIAKAAGLAGAGVNLTLSGALMGTPEYMAPEQAHSADRADARADVYSVGVMLYEMIAGARPVDGEDPRLVALKVERGEVKPLIHRVPEVPRDLAGLVHRAMAPRPDLRFAGAAEMRQALLSLTMGPTGEKKPSVVQAPSPTPSPSVAPASAAPATTPDPARGTGTVFGDPQVPANASPDGAAARQAAGATDPGGSPYGAAYGTPPAGPARYPSQPPRAPYASSPSQPPLAQGSPYGSPPAGAARGRRRGGGGPLWIIIGLLALVGGGVGLAFAFGGSSNNANKKTPAAGPSSTPAEVASADPNAPAPGPSSSAGAPDEDPIGPLPAGPKPPHAVVNAPPHGSSSASPAGSASGAPSGVPSAPMPSLGAPPFGLPPFTLPSGLPSLPNPFPSPQSSGVGPVLTIPTAFPPFQLPESPPSPPSSAPAPPSSAKPHRPGH